MELDYFHPFFLSVVGVNFIYINKNLSIHQLLGSWKLQEITPILVKNWSKSTSIKYYFTLFCKVSSSSLVYKESAIFIFHNDSTRYICTAYKQTPNNSVDWKMRLLRLKSFPMSFLRKSSLILEGNLNQLLIEPTFDYNIPAYSKYPFMEIDLPILSMIYLTQYASKKDHLRNIKITKFQNLFREAWGCW